MIIKNKYQRTVIPLTIVCASHDQSTPETPETR